MEAVKKSNIANLMDSDELAKIKEQQEAQRANNSDNNNIETLMNNIPQDQREHNVFSLTQAGGIRSNDAHNAKILITYDPLTAGKIARNEFTHETELLGDVIINGKTFKKGSSISDDFLKMITEHLAIKYKVSHAKPTINDAIEVVGMGNSFDPLKDYLEDAYKKWDKDRQTTIPDFLPTFLGVEKNKLNTLMFTKFLIGAVARVVNPAEKVDLCLDLIGGQGAGKTTLLQKLAVNWYTDGFTRFNDKDAYAQMLKAWIINDDEMTATKKSTNEELKQFITKKTLEYREPYGVKVNRYTPRYAIARTTNDTHYLNDKTGSRRFLPILVHKDAQTLKPTSDDLSESIIRMIWGEAYYLYTVKNEKPFFTDKEEQELSIYRDSFRYVDEFDESIEKAVTELTTGPNPQTFITRAEIGEGIDQGFNEIKAEFSKLARRINKYMNANSSYSYTRHRVNGVQKRGWLKIK